MFPNIAQCSWMFLVLAACLLLLGDAYNNAAATTGSIRKKSKNNVRYYQNNNDLIVVKPNNITHNPQQQQQQQQQRRRRRRNLPPKIIVGYSTKCDDHVVQSVREGVNVVIWHSIKALLWPQRDNGSLSSKITVQCIQEIIQQLDKEGYMDTVHLIDFGGWDGKHLDEYDNPPINTTNVQQWYQTIWKGNNAASHATIPLGTLFHGIGWDLEGHDNLTSPRNYFTMDCLDTMGLLSKLMHQDGYIVSMAPAQSYWDPSHDGFSRYVNLTVAQVNRSWPTNGFHYFGSNVYAYLTAKYGEFIDFVSIQFYESYSRAAMYIHHYNMTPHNYLRDYILNHLVIENDNEAYLQFWVNFEQDSHLQYPSQTVSLPLNKLVWGFANAWAIDPTDKDGKKLYIEPPEIGLAYHDLTMQPKEDVTPRGFMFWVIRREGDKGIDFTKGLNDTLHIRNSSNTMRTSTATQSALF